MNGQIRQDVLRRTTRQIPVRKQSRVIFKEYLGYVASLERDSISVYPRMSPNESVIEFIHRIRDIYDQQVRSCRLASGRLMSRQVSVLKKSKRIFKKYLGYTVPIERDSISVYPRMSPNESVIEFINKIRDIYKQQIKSGLSNNDSTREMTQDQIAFAIAQDKNGIKILTPKRLDDLKTKLYQSIRKMIYQVATKYSVNSIDNVDDLAQDCTYRVLSQIHKFDPSFGRFTTWTWHVCGSVLNKKFQVGKKLRKLFINESQLYREDDDDNSRRLENLPARPVGGVQHHECNGVMANEIVEAVRGLVVKYPKYKNLILEIFGNPDRPDFAIPSYISVSEAAKAIGMSYGRARVFFSNIIRPFFREQFAGC